LVTNFSTFNFDAALLWALDKLQADKARLSDVALSFGYFIKFWEQNSDRSLAEGMISRLEKR